MLLHNNIFDSNYIFYNMKLLSLSFSKFFNILKDIIAHNLQFHVPKQNNFPSIGTLMHKNRIPNEKLVI